MGNKKLLGPIEHVVVLIFESCSFDNMLGGLYEHSEFFEGVPKDWSNPNTALSEIISAFCATPDRNENKAYPKLRPMNK